MVNVKRIGLVLDSTPYYPTMSFIKRFPSTVPYQEIRREARLQRLANGIGLAPRVTRCNATSIVMENLQSPCLGDVYGDDPEDVPEWIREEILDILYTLYTTLGIEYVDVTPYNFIEKDGVVWIIDFGHARLISDDIDPYLDDLFATWEIAKWNPDFA